MKRAIVAAAALAALVWTGTAVAAEDPFLSQMVGTWIGRGTSKANAAATPERVYCKVSNTLSPGGSSLIQKGRCSLASNSGAIKGTITALGNNAYAGEMASLASRGPATLSGALQGDRLVLSAKFADKLSGDPVEATNTLALTSNGYQLTATRPDPKTGATFTSSDILFTAK